MGGGTAGAAGSGSGARGGGSASRVHCASDIASLHLPLVDSELTQIAMLADLSPPHSPLDGAAVLVRVGAVRVAAQRHERPKLGEEAFDFLGQHAPRLKLPHAGRIHYPAAEIEP